MKKKKSAIKIILMLLLLILLGGGYAAITVLDPFAEEEVEEEEEDEVVKEVEADTISKIVYSQGKETIELYLDGETWKTSNDEKCSVNQYTVSAMLNALKEVKTSRTLKAEEIDEEAFGFKKPEKVITFETTEGETITYTIGALNEIVDKYYFQISGDENAYLIDSTMYNSFDYSLLKLAEVAEFPAFSAEDLYAISIKKEGKTKVYMDVADAAHKKNEETVPESAWKQYVNGKTKKVDKDKMQKAVDSIVSLSNSECVSYAATEKEKKACGLDQPSYVLTVNYTTDSVNEDKKIQDEEFSVYVGDTDKDSGEYYVYTSFDEGIYTMNVSTLSDIIAMAK